MTAIGVSGHRVLAEESRVAAGVDEALALVAATRPSEAFRVLSALAEGADRLVVRRALETGVFDMGGAPPAVVVPLPRPAADYATDFDSPESRAAFESMLSAAAEVEVLTPGGSDHEAGYGAVADYLAEHSDVLLAIWDGQEADNDVGTAAVVARARRRGMPVAWVHAGNRRPGTMEPMSLGEEQGTVTFERF